MPLVAWGEPLPSLVLPGLSNPRYALGSVAGRWMALLFLPRAGGFDATALEAAVAAIRGRLDDSFGVLFVVAPRAEDLTTGPMRDSIPGIRVLADPDGAALAALGGDPAAGVAILADPTHRVLASGPLADAPAILAALSRLPPPERHAGPEVTAPVLVPRLLEPGLCRKLIELYETGVAKPSGFMREVDGKTVGTSDPGFKRRSDHDIADQDTLNAPQRRLKRRLVPAIRQAFQFDATRIERFIVACYDAAEGGFFRAHRDNTTRGTAHRRFAVTVNLNAEAFEGGELRFPEFGPRLYRAPTGGAVVFSCSLLHEATPVTRGRRYAFLPFLYDEEGARIRQENLGFLAGNVVLGAEGAGEPVRAA